MTNISFQTNEHVAMLLDLFRRQQRKRGEAAIETIVRALRVQLTSSAADSQAIAADHWALGYTFGFGDAVLQQFGIHDKKKCLALLAISYFRLFDDAKLAGTMVRRCLDLRRNKTFIKGALAGSREAVEFRKSTTAPLALAKHMQGRKTHAE